MTPYISVIVPVARIGGLDVIFASLENQTFKDFELILVDSLYKYRKDVVAEKSKEYSFQYKHIPPIRDIFPVQAYCHANNSALVQCSGDVVLFTSDYRYFMPSCLKNIADFHKIHADNIGYSTPTREMVAPHIKNDLPSYGNDYEQYMKDLDNGLLDQHMWSVYSSILDKNSYPPIDWPQHDPNIYGYDSKIIIMPGTEVPHSLIYLQGESMKTKVALEANGLNEALDGSHLWQDWEFTYRLRNMFDFKWLGNGTDLSYRLTGGHEIIQRLKHTRPSGSNEHIYQKYKDGSKDQVNDWNLLEAHINLQNKGIK